MPIVKEDLTTNNPEWLGYLFTMGWSPVNDELMFTPINLGDSSVIMLRESYNISVSWILFYFIFLNINKVGFLFLRNAQYSYDFVIVFAEGKTSGSSDGCLYMYFFLMKPTSSGENVRDSQLLYRYFRRHGVISSHGEYELFTLFVLYYIYLLFTWMASQTLSYQDLNY